jgi:hypothetical protein
MNKKTMKSFQREEVDWEQDKSETMNERTMKSVRREEVDGEQDNAQRQDTRMLIRRASDTNDSSLGKLREAQDKKAGTRTTIQQRVGQIGTLADALAGTLGPSSLSMTLHCSSQLFTAWSSCRIA